MDLHIYSHAPLDDYPALRQIRITSTFLRSLLQSQNDVLNGGISLHVDWFRVSGTDFSLYDDQQTADRWVSKWPPAFKISPRCFLGWILRYTGTENGHRMEDLRWTVSFSANWNALNELSMHFNGIFSFHLTMFSLYSNFAGTN